MHSKLIKITIKSFASWNKTKDQKVSTLTNAWSAGKLSKQSVGRGVYLSIDSLFIKHHVVRQTTSHDKIVYIMSNTIKENARCRQPSKNITRCNRLRYFHAFNQNEHCYVNIAPTKGIKGDNGPQVSFWHWLLSSKVQLSNLNHQSKEYFKN